MDSGTDISVLYREFTDALTEVLAENAVGPARRGRLARARAAVKRHTKYSEHEYFLAVETLHTVGGHAKRRSLAAATERRAGIPHEGSLFDRLVGASLHRLRNG